MGAIAELEAAAQSCEEAAAVFNRDPLASLVRKAREASSSLSASWSGSWAGYQARCYWDNFEPANSVFSVEWGIHGASSNGVLVSGNWREYREEEVYAEILRRAQVENLDLINDAAREAKRVFARSKQEILTTLDALLGNRPDPVLNETRDEVAKLKDSLSSVDIVHQLAPNQIFTRDRRVQSERTFQTPPHIGLEADIVSSISHGRSLSDLAQAARTAALYLKKRGEAVVEPSRRALVNTERTEQPWDLWGAGLFAVGVLLGAYGDRGLAAVHQAALSMVRNASPVVKAVVVGLSIGVALAVAGIAGNLVASHLGRGDGTLLGVLRRPRVRVLFFLAVVLAAVAHALSQL